ncbi:Arylsulfatase A [Mariniphaga anaerophila]|uniref:Arylsulfatase A n=1 Tax=Mariniphaga anaerophila TaxID=1484053 RepID=A0A1M4V912_9BACT|nr:sulfatase [Mariniphaga anaerophila]SHE65377.1 Arylsulfatase A [Mariniphaga anaerophila]
MLNKVAVTIFLLVFGCLWLNAKDKKHPNVIFILVDDLGWKDISSFGSDFYQTPHVDDLASDGVMFTNAYSACTVCSPSRASIMTGKYPARLRCTDWIEGWKYPKAKLKVPDWTMYLDSNEVTLAEVFKNNGYKTIHIGKWHLGEEEKHWPENHGFDVNIGGWAKGSPNRNKKQGYNGYFPPFGNPRLTDCSDDEYLTERLANEACSFLEKNQEKPFFMNLWFYNVHTPLQATAEKVEKYKSLLTSENRQDNPVYAAMVEHMDDAVGKITEKLKDLELYENTIIIFTSDNGGLIGNGKQPVTNNYPLRSGKGDIYEGGVRVPLVIRVPGITSPGIIDSTSMIISPDFMPSLIKLAKLDVDRKVMRSFDGVDISPVLRNSSAKLGRNEIFWHYPHYHIEGATPYSSVRKGDWKLIHIMETDEYKLFNLKKDIGETTELSSKYPKKVQNLKRDMAKWKNRVDAQMPTSNPDYER